MTWERAHKRRKREAREKAMTQESAATGAGMSDAELMKSITAMLALDTGGAAIPHGCGGHARELLSASLDRLASLRRELDEAKSLMNLIGFIQGPVRYSYSGQTKTVQVSTETADKWNIRLDALNRLSSPAPASPAAEPAAWKYDHPKHGTRISVYRQENDAHENGWTETPLYSAPASPAAGVREGDAGLEVNLAACSKQVQKLRAEKAGLRAAVVEECANTIERGFSLADADTDFSDGIKYGLEAAVKWVRALALPHQTENEHG